MIIKLYYIILHINYINNVKKNFFWKLLFLSPAPPHSLFGHMQFPNSKYI